MPRIGLVSYFSDLMNKIGETYYILLSIVHTFYIQNDAEIFLAHYTWTVAEKGFKMAFTLYTSLLCDILYTVNNSIRVCLLYTSLRLYEPPLIRVSAYTSLLSTE